MKFLFKQLPGLFTVIMAAHVGGLLTVPIEVVYFYLGWVAFSCIVGLSLVIMTTQNWHIIANHMKQEHAERLVYSESVSVKSIVISILNVIVLSMLGYGLFTVVYVVISLMAYNVSRRLHNLALHVLGDYK